jgi:hypothetical protein
MDEREAHDSYWPTTYEGMVGSKESYIQLNSIYTNLLRDGLDRMQEYPSKV